MGTHRRDNHRDKLVRMTRPKNRAPAMLLTLATKPLVVKLVENLVVTMRSRNTPK